MVVSYAGIQVESGNKEEKSGRISDNEQKAEKLRQCTAITSASFASIHDLILRALKLPSSAGEE